jgi:hypothetical protein
VTRLALHAACQFNARRAVRQRNREGKIKEVDSSRSASRPPSRPSRLRLFRKLSIARFVRQTRTITYEKSAPVKFFSPVFQLEIAHCATIRAQGCVKRARAPCAMKGGSADALRVLFER